VSEALDVLSALVLEDGRRWGESAAEFQWEDARAVLDREGRPNHFLTRARGGSKTSDLAGMAIAVGLTQSPPHTRMYGLAAARDQAALLLDSVAGFYSRTPELQGTLTVREHKVYFHATNSMLHILPADQATLWGLRPYFVIVDEIGQWHTTPPPQRCYEAVSTAAAKMADSRMVLLTTASDPAHWSARVIQAARDDELWRVHEVHGPPPWMNEQRLEGERRRLPESSFRRLFLNEWAAGEDRLATEEDLIAAIRLDGYQEPERGKRYVIGLDVGLTADATVACVCHAEREEGHEHPTVVLDRMQVWHGSLKQPVQLQQVEDWIEEAASRYNRASVRFDPYQAVHLAQRLKRKGLHVSEFVFSASSVGKLANVLLQLIREHSLAIPEEPELLDELRNVRLKESSPNVYRIDHDRFQHDDRVIALALAANWLTERSGSSKARVYSSFKTAVPA
jgi:hypothetical protein